MAKPTLHYFRIRGRGEPMRLILHLKGVDHDDVGIDFASMKQDLEGFPFAQTPRYVDGDVDITQSNAIVRYLGHKYGMMGGTPKQTAEIDMVAEGIESVRGKYGDLIYGAKLADEAKEAYWKTHCDPATTGERNGGAHFAYLEALLKKSSSGWTAGTAEPNVADVQLFDVFDLHARIFGDKLKAAYPALAALHDRFASIPEIKAYLGSDRRQATVNGVPLG